MTDAKYIGLDVHQATISAAVLDSTGPTMPFSGSRSELRGSEQLADPRTGRRGGTTHLCGLETKITRGES